MDEAKNKIKTKEAFEKAKIQELKRKKLQGDLIPKEDVLSMFDIMQEMRERGEEVDFDLIRERVKTFTLN